ncbi:hypothetical protein BC832DRAFT_594030 [Gaertneriomyces semiglobifer]|nr:hypothetical protein BC832DRAFT_594030 [Gaertneriomyces semiglobifer]
MKNLLIAATVGLLLGSVVPPVQAQTRSGSNEDGIRAATVFVKACAATGSVCEPIPVPTGKDIKITNGTVVVVGLEGLTKEHVEHFTDERFKQGVCALNYFQEDGTQGPASVFMSDTAAAADLLAYNTTAQVPTKAFVPIYALNTTLQDDHTQLVYETSNPA